MQAAKNMLRKQVMLLPEHVKKLQALAKKEKTSASDIVRRALDAYDPNTPWEINESKLLELAHAEVKEAIEHTIRTHRKVKASLDGLESRG